MPSQEPRPSWTRYAGMGFEFAASLVVCMLVGYWVDYHWRIERHWGLLIGTLVGVIGGTYNFVREAIQAVRDFDRQGADRKRPPPDRPGAKDSKGTADDPDRGRRDGSD